ncbi:hypothetical protein Ae201684_016702 [Aphanomyces euteiches]|uniref:Reverse transcriptase Ty1/copia-type domain-containing protein n=1 Tax=Aphanomyces euteiches TaxID=100861 RepID=A0A6G0WBS3_9STRA|nr:hypothetical protein Ae201684_016702 [Aphanomyces euteiches]
MSIQQITNTIHCGAIGAKRVLVGATNHGIIYGGNAKKLEGYCDASWATRPDQRSTTGFLWSFLGGPLTWKSVRQRVTALSSCKAEYIAAAEAARESIWLRGLLADMEFVQDCVVLVLYCDNKSAISTANSCALNERNT